MDWDWVMAWAVAGWTSSVVWFVKWRVAAMKLSGTVESCRFLNGLLDKMADSRREEREETRRSLEAMKQAHELAEREWHKSSLALLRIQRVLTEREE